jgi:hypothetical protein
MTRGVGKVRRSSFPAVSVRPTKASDVLDRWQQDAPVEPGKLHLAVLSEETIPCDVVIGIALGIRVLLQCGVGLPEGKCGLPNEDGLFGRLGEILPPTREGVGGIVGGSRCCNTNPFEVRCLISSNSALSI